MSYQEQATINGPLFPLKASLLMVDREQIRNRMRDCDQNASYNANNGFEASAEKNKIEGDFYLYLSYYKN